MWEPQGRMRIRTNTSKLSKRVMEENDTRFQKVGALLGKKELQEAYMEVERIINSSRPFPFTLMKCAALLLTVDKKERSDEVASMALGCPLKDDDEIVQLSIAMRGLGRYGDSLSLLERVGTDLPGLDLERARTLIASGDADSCLEILDSIAGIEADLIRCGALSRTGSHDEAIALAKKIVEDRGLDYETGSLLLGSMLRAGLVKEAKRLANSMVKDAKDADSLALKAYVMRINGRTPAAMNYANQSLLKEPCHIGALWNLALCLLEKGRKDEAKLLAGAINEASPASPLALEILDLCNR